MDISFPQKGMKRFPFRFNSKSEIYGNIKSRFLQMIMFNPVFKMCDAVERLSELSCSHVKEESVERLIQQLNPRLNYYYQQIKCMTFNKTGEKYLILCNSERNEFSMSLSICSEKESAFISRINNSLLAREKTNTELINLHKYVNPLISKKEAQEIINMLIREHWLYEQEGIISFGIRSIAENIPHNLTFGNVNY